MPHFFTLVRPIRESFPVDMTPEEFSLIGEHIAYLTKNCNDGVVLLAGPTRDKDPIGLAVIEVPDLEAAEAFLANDPAVVKGLFRADAPRPYSIAVMRGLEEDSA